MRGAQALIRTLVDSGVDTCFTNPGTSEMHFVAELDNVAEMRAILALFEGVATGAADGYGRMTGRPAATLLHLGPGLGNGLANLHNARRAHTPLVSIVGDHATYHKAFDAPLESDIDGVARTVSAWVHRSDTAGDVAGDAAAAVAAAHGPPGQIATLILPADVSWSDGAAPATREKTAAAATVADRTVAAVAAALSRREPAVILLGYGATAGAGLSAAARVAEETGGRLLCETFPARLERGAGRPPVERLEYLVEWALEQLDGTRHLILAGASSPVGFFAYPGLPSDLVPEGCTVQTLAAPGDDVAEALAHLAEVVGATAAGPVAASGRPAVPDGALTAMTAAAVIGALLPEGAIVVDESLTSGGGLTPATAGAPPHDWLTLTGGAIGDGLPTATGAAVACPDRPVICLESDGSAMYTISALWTQAREGLDVTTVLFANRAYGILNFELHRVGAEGSGRRAADLFDLSRPTLQFATLAQGMGVPSCRATSVAELHVGLARALAEPGPHLIEVVLPG